jgi:DNA invertase Pin-like site-specific DNA recombinase
MAKVGYIFNSECYDNFDEDKKWMEDYGCCRIVVESSIDEKARPKWKELLDCTERGDELIVAKFSNAVRGTRELAVLIEFCRIKVLRIISIHDRIDSKGKLFPDTSSEDILNMFGSLPEEVVALRKQYAHEEALKTNPKLFAKQEAIRDKQERKMEQERQIISMYRSNISINEIWKKSGYASRSSVFRVLNKYGINLNRGKFKGPLGKRKPKASTGQEE